METHFLSRNINQKMEKGIYIFLHLAQRSHKVVADTQKKANETRVLHKNFSSFNLIPGI